MNGQPRLTPAQKAALQRVVQQAVSEALGPLGDVIGKASAAGSGTLAQRLEAMERRVAEDQRRYASPPLTVSSQSRNRQGEVDELLAKADAATDHALAQGYRARARALASRGQ